jgi:hypothetical protein
MTTSKAASVELVDVAAIVARVEACGIPRRL